MDAMAQLALMSKANQVFGGPGIFLSFPALTPIAYKPDNLNFANPFASPEILHTLADLSLNVNALPGGALFSGASDTYLWQAYRQWLSDMVLAKDQMTAEEQAQYDQANVVLSVKDANGLLLDSPKVVAYKQYRDFWFSAAQNYKNQQLTASTSSDPVVQNQWKSVDEPHLRALVDEAMSDWESKGYKTEVENAQQVVAQLESRSPSKAWQEWNNALNPDLDLPTDPSSNMQFAPTAFSPSDLFAQDWPTFHLVSTEIAQLAQSAPDELRSIFSAASGASSITSLSFEFRSAALVRPWLNTAVFNTRFWKFHAGAALLSDGATPPQGSWPAYISAVVFVRNIQMTTQAAPQTQHLASFPPVSKMMLSNVALAKLTQVKPLPIAGTGSTIPHPLVSPKAAASGMVATSMVHMLAADIAPQPVKVSHVTRLVNVTYRLPVFVKQPAGSSTGAPTAQPATDAPNNDVSILAFICKSLPQTPNPDPALDWSA